MRALTAGAFSSADVWVSGRRWAGGRGPRLGGASRHGGKETQTSGQVVRDWTGARLLRRWGLRLGHPPGGKRARRLQREGYRISYSRWSAHLRRGGEVARRARPSASTQRYHPQLSARRRRGGRPGGAPRRRLRPAAPQPPNKPGRRWARKGLSASALSNITHATSRVGTRALTKVGRDEHHGLLVLHRLALVHQVLHHLARLQVVRCSRGGRGGRREGRQGWGSGNGCATKYSTTWPACTLAIDGAAVSAEQWAGMQALHRLARAERAPGAPPAASACPAAQ